MSNLKQDLEPQGKGLALTTVLGAGLTYLEQVKRARAVTPKLYNTEDVELINALMKVSTMIGAPPPNAIEFNILREMLAFGDFKSIYLGEIYIAFSMAVGGKLDEPPAALNTYGKPINTLVISRVLQSYQRHKLNTLKLATIERDEDEEVKQIPREERAKLMVEASLKAYEHYKGTGEVRDYGNTVHNFLYVNGLFTRDAEDIKNLDYLARKQYREEALAMASKRGENREIREILNQLDMVPTPDDLEVRLATLRRRISLKHFFEELDFNEQELKPLLDKVQTFKFYRANETKNT